MVSVQNAIHKPQGLFPAEAEKHDENSDGVKEMFSHEPESETNQLSVWQALFQSSVTR